MRRRGLTLRFLMVGILFAAVWLYIVVQSHSYQKRYPDGADFLNPVVSPTP